MVTLWASETCFAASTSGAKNASTDSSNFSNAPLIRLRSCMAFHSVPSRTTLPELPRMSVPSTRTWSLARLMVVNDMMSLLPGLVMYQRRARLWVMQQELPRTQSWV